MLTNLKTPGVYLEEINAFPGSVVGVETAVPVFIGYTEKADFNGKPLLKVPTRITSFGEYVERFGHGYKHRFGLPSSSSPVVVVPAGNDIESIKKNRLAAAEEKKKTIDTAKEKKKEELKLDASNDADKITALDTAAEELKKAVTARAEAENDEDEKDESLKKVTEKSDLENSIQALLDKAIKDSANATEDAAKDIKTKSAAALEAVKVIAAAIEAVNANAPKVPAPQVKPISPIKAFKSEMVKDPADKFYFYNCIRLFYQNGGSNCYIMSLGTYGEDTPVANKITSVNLAHFTKEDIFETLEKEYEPTMVLMPDVISKYQKPQNTDDSLECYQPYTKVLEHCAKTQSRFGVFDVMQDPTQTPLIDILQFRNSIGTLNLKYGAAYYPWLKTSIVSVSEIDFTNLDILLDDLEKLLPVNEVSEVFKSWNKEKTNLDENLKTETDSAIAKGKVDALNTQLHQSLYETCPIYKQIILEVRAKLNLLPPSSAMAGIYTAIDNSRGVWKSPANVSVSAVNAPSINISNEQQNTMNVDAIAGKSINVIRPFPGIGTLVWGARTLDGNSQDWRYINVRRTMIYIEQSLKLACRAYVFEPNDSGTWVTMQSMMNNFLFNLWKQGALQGTVPEQAYDVQIGLGKTMTPTDLLDGYLRVSVKVAIVRPAEFIVITFQQLQQQA